MHDLSEITRQRSEELCFFLLQSLIFCTQSPILLFDPFDFINLQCTRKMKKYRITHLSGEFHERSELNSYSYSKITQIRNIQILHIYEFNSKSKSHSILSKITQVRIHSIHSKYKMILLALRKANIFDVHHYEVGPPT